MLLLAREGATAVHWSFGKTGTLGITLASQAEIGVWVQAPGTLLTFRRRADDGSSWVVMARQKYRQFGRFLSSLEPKNQLGLLASRPL